MDNGEYMGEYVLDVLSSPQAGMLPALTEVIITRLEEEMHDKVLPIEQFQVFGVILKVEVVNQFPDKFQKGSSSFDR